MPAHLHARVWKALVLYQPGENTGMPNLFRFVAFSQARQQFCFKIATQLGFWRFLFLFFPSFNSFTSFPLVFIGMGGFFFQPCTHVCVRLLHSCLVAKRDWGSEGLKDGQLPRIDNISLVFQTWLILEALFPFLCLLSLYWKCTSASMDVDSS